MKMVFLGGDIRMVAVALLFFAGTARGDDSPYCRKVRARAASEAALLMSPEVHVQAIRFPENGRIDSGAIVGTDRQVRAGLSFSPIDFYKGLGVMRVGEADCARHESSEALDQLLTPASDGARLVALRQQAEFLGSHRSEWQALAAKAEERYAARVITLAELDQLRWRTNVLEHRLIEVEGEARRLQARNPEVPALPGDLLAQQLYDRSVELEKEESHLRTLDAWDLRLSGGVIPRVGPVDWYGLVEVRFKPGALVRNHQEARYLEARADELRSARYEPQARVRRHQDEVRAVREQARRDLELTDHQLSTLASSRGLLQDSTAPSGVHTRDALKLEELSMQADRVFLFGLARALSDIL